MTRRSGDVSRTTSGVNGGLAEISIATRSFSEVIATFLMTPTRVDVSTVAELAVCARSRNSTPSETHAIPRSKVADRRNLDLPAPRCMPRILRNSRRRRTPKSTLIQRGRVQGIVTWIGSDLMLSKPLMSTAVAA